MSVIELGRGKPSIYINKPIGRIRKVRMSILTDDELKDILVSREIPGITIQPIQTRLKVIINCEYYQNSNLDEFKTLLYGIRKKWFDVVQLVITNTNRNYNDGFFHSEYTMFIEMLKVTISSTKKIILSVDISRCVLKDISEFLEKTTIPMITIQSPNMNVDSLSIIEEAISRNENIIDFNGIESDHIRDTLRRNIRRKAFINRLKVQAGPDVKKNIIGFL
jgi:hypothetical protein